MFIFLQNVVKPKPGSYVVNLMKKLVIICLAIFVCAFTSLAQAPKETVSKRDKPKVYKADPKDVGSIDAIIKATYDVISGGIGEKRNWDRFYSLFHPSARLIPTGKNRQTGIYTARSQDPKGYQERSANFLVNNGFRESEIARKTDQFGNIAHVFSTYEGKFTANGQARTIRGINSFQLLNDGKRWWIMTIYWQAESADNPIPAKYLKNQ